MGWFQQLNRGRLISTGGATAQAVANDPDGPLARMAKFIPAEIIGGYLFFDNTLHGIMTTGKAPVIWSKEFWIAAMLIVICWAVSPLYYLKIDGDPASRKKHAWMAAIAFPVWAYASGGPFVYFHLHSPLLAAFGLVVASLIGLFV